MAFVRLAFFPGGTPEHYRALERALGDAPSPPGRRVFAVGALDDGLQVVQVWESKAQLDAFNAEWLAPAMARVGSAGFPAPPTVTDFESLDLDIGPGGSHGGQ